MLAWDQEECRAWYVDFPTTNQRPVAWTQGTVTPGTCDTTGEKVWTVMSEKQALFPGLGAPGGVIVSLVDGATGAIDKQITIPTFSGDSFGAYGGAVNAHGDLFFTSMAFNGGRLARVYIDNFAYKVWDVPPDIGPYGITVDHLGKVWMSSAAINTNGVGRFDPEAETWDLSASHRVTGLLNYRRSFGDRLWCSFSSCSFCLIRSSSRRSLSTLRCCSRVSGNFGATSWQVRPLHSSSRISWA